MIKIDLSAIGTKQAEFLEKAYRNGQLNHSYLFVDQDEDRALRTAYWLACLVNCTGSQPPDGTCANCQQILTGNHPDVLLVEPEGKKTLGIDQVRPLKEELAKSPMQGKLRLFFIKNAEKLTLPAANALLNLLEEPVAPVVTILITNNSAQILPTVYSRVQVVNFDTPQHPDRASALLDDGFSQAEIAELDFKTLDQQIKYFYQEMLEFNSLALISAHELADGAANSQQKYVLFRLKELAQADLLQGNQAGTKMLKYLINVDKMWASNVNFRNLLDYLALQWKR